LSGSDEYDGLILEMRFNDSKWAKLLESSSLVVRVRDIEYKKK
jgi:hypothetical protein